jgi:very-short-patch-repair endonuclease
MRRNPTEPERRLWMALRDSRFFGYKFRRQATIGSRIADFFCPEKGLIVEVDGETHDRERDLRRDAVLAREFGYRVLRFTNLEVMREMEGGLVSLRLVLDAQPDRWPGRRRKHHPLTPSSEEEGG